MPEQFEGFNPPVFTQTPNELFDELLSQITSLCELKVLMVAIRQTLGWHKKSDTISFSQFAKLSGLTRRGAIDGVELCLKRGTILRKPSKRNNGFVYQLNIKTSSEQNTPLSPPSSEQNTPPPKTKRCKSFTTSSEQNTPLSPPSSEQNTPTKEIDKEKKEIETAIAVLPEKNGHYKIYEAYCGVLGIDPKKEPEVAKARELKYAKQLHSKKYTPEQVGTCMRKILKDTFWDDKVLSLATVAKQIQKTLNGPSPGQAPSPPKASIRQGPEWEAFNEDFNRRSQQQGAVT